MLAVVDCIVHLCAHISLPIQPPHCPRTGLSSQSASTGNRQGSRGGASAESSSSGMGTLLKRRKIFQVTLIFSKHSSKCLKVHRIESLYKQHHDCSTKQKMEQFSGDRGCGQPSRRRLCPATLQLPVVSIRLLPLSLTLL